MKLPTKMLVAGLVLAVVSVAIGLYLAQRAEKNIPSMLVDCSSIKPTHDLDYWRKEARETFESLPAPTQKVDDQLIENYADSLMKSSASMRAAFCRDRNDRTREIPGEKTEAAILIAGAILTVSALPWFSMIALPRLWIFLLLRIREVSKAITGK